MPLRSENERFGSVSMAYNYYWVILEEFIYWCLCNHVETGLDVAAWLLSMWQFMSPLFLGCTKKTLQNDCFHTNGCGPLTLTKQTWWSLERGRLEIKPITLVIGGGQVSAMYSGFVSFCPGPSELLGFWGTFCEPA